MRTLTQHLTHYAAYHRDRRNLVTHFIGIPMIVVAVATLLARPTFEVAGLVLTPALVYTAFIAAYYLLLDLRLGLATAAVLAVAVASGQWFGAQSTPVWLSAGLGLFVVGWVIQFIGHHYEGRKPALFDDISGLVLAVGVVFLIAEAAFAMGFRRELQRTIEGSVGPLHASDLSLGRG